MESTIVIAGLSVLLGAGIVGVAIVASSLAHDKHPPPIVIDIRSNYSPEESHHLRKSHQTPRETTQTNEFDMDDPRVKPEVDPRREINIPTRGAPPRFEQIGYLSSDQHSDVQVNNIIPLFGRRTYAGSGNWNYYTKTQAGVKIPLSMDGRDCSDDIPGCRELYDEDVVNVPALDGDYSVSLYNIGTPRYIPYV